MTQPSAKLPRMMEALPVGVGDVVELCYRRHQPSEELRAKLRRRRLHRQEDDRVRLVRRLLPVLDAVDRMNVEENEVDADPRVGNYQRGLMALRKRLSMLLEREGVTPMACIGKPVDLDRHEVVELVDGPPDSAPVIVKELERGYLLDGRTLRDAKVVATRPTTPVDGDAPPAESVEPEADSANNEEPVT